MHWKARAGRYFEFFMQHDPSLPPHPHREIFSSTPLKTCSIFFYSNANICSFKIPLKHDWLFRHENQWARHTTTHILVTRLTTADIDDAAHTLGHGWAKTSSSLRVSGDPNTHMSHWNSEKYDLMTTRN